MTLLFTNSVWEKMADKKTERKIRLELAGWVKGRGWRYEKGRGRCKRGRRAEVRTEAEKREWKIQHGCHRVY